MTAEELVVIVAAVLSLLVVFAVNAAVVQTILEQTLSNERASYLSELKAAEKRICDFVKEVVEQRKAVPQLRPSPYAAYVTPPDNGTVAITTQPEHRGPRKQLDVKQAEELADRLKEIY
jgi:hypothetical protein